VELESLSCTHEQLNEELRSSQVRYRALFELSPQPISVYDRDTFQILAVNNSSVANYGYSREEFLSMTLADLVPLEDIPAFERYAASRARSREQGGGRGLTLARLWRHRLKDGTVIDVEITSDDIVFDGRACRILLSQDVTARKCTAAELAVAHDAAVEASTLKSAFLANISHEMRTPMNGVLGMNGLLLATHLTEEQRSYAAQVSRSGEEMMAIIDDVLDVAKIEAGGILLDLTDFPLREAVERSCALGVRQATAKGLAFELRFDDAVPQHAHGDDLRLRRIVANLVSNAVKFTAVGSVVVRVSARAASDSGALRIRVEVVDTGIGVDPAALEQMFEPFTQADTSMTRAYGGAGLGLTIARNVVALMGGTLGADSLLGGGSTFWFEVDLRPAVDLSQRHDLRRAGSPAIRALSRSWSSKGPHVFAPRRRRWN
jgi:PAS domain S-box-containing protein